MVPSYPKGFKTQHLTAKVVAIDDDKAVLRSLQHALTSLDIELICFNKGLEALEYLLKSDVDLLLVDLGLPDLNGEDLLNKLQQNNKVTPFVLITGADDLSLAVNWMKRGAIDYLVKSANLVKQVPALVTRSLQQIEQQKVYHSMEQNLLMIQAAIDQAGEGILVFKPTGEQLVLYINAALTKMLGVTREKVMHHSAKEIAGVGSALAQLEISELAHDIKLHGLKILHCLHEGRNMECRVSPVQDDDGGIKHCIAIIQDVTERRRMERQLMNAQKMESIGRLASGVAHEINTPLQYLQENLRFIEKYMASLIKAAAALDQSKVTLPQGVDLEFTLRELPAALRDSLEGVEHVAGIVKAMNDFSHPGASHSVLFDVNRAIQGSITMTRNRWKSIARVVTQFDPAIPEIYCHPNEIQRVFLNLMINAIDAIEQRQAEQHQGLGVIAVRSKLLDKTIEIRIRDTGSGIPKEVESRIFEPFFTTKDIGQGTGQGLALAHSVIHEHHGGTIEFETETDRGTIFIVNLPLEVGESADQDIAA